MKPGEMIHLELKEGELTTLRFWEVLRSCGIKITKSQTGLEFLGTSEKYVWSKKKILNAEVSWTAFYKVLTIDENEFAEPDYKRQLLRLLAMHLTRLAQRRIDYGAERSKILYHRRKFNTTVNDSFPDQAAVTHESLENILNTMIIENDDSENI